MRGVKWDRDCSISGCKKPAKVRGWCHKHYSRWQKWGDPKFRKYRPPNMTRAEITEYERKRTTQDGECSLTKTSQTRNGYGTVPYRGKTVYIHRLVLEEKLGRTLQEGECALHRCHRPACINPDHLYVGSKAQNSRDMVLAGRHVKATAKLSYPIAQEIRSEYAKGNVSQIALGQKYGVAQVTISQIVLGKRWK